jgi:hypothetical protein
LIFAQRVVTAHFALVCQMALPTRKELRLMAQVKRPILAELKE